VCVAGFGDYLCCKQSIVFQHLFLPNAIRMAFRDLELSKLFAQQTSNWPHRRRRYANQLPGKCIDSKEVCQTRMQYFSQKNSQIFGSIILNKGPKESLGSLIDRAAEARKSRQQPSRCSHYRESSQGELGFISVTRSNHSAASRPASGRSELSSVLPLQV